jgi:DNA-binding beta-propeller fold protein YncE
MGTIMPCLKTTICKGGAMADMRVGTSQNTYEVLYPFGNLPPDMTYGNVSHVATDSKNQVYFFQRKDPPVLVFGSEGNLLRTWGKGVLFDGHGIFISASDEVFLIDRDAHEVLKFNTEGKVLLKLGTRGKPSLQAPFNHPADVAVSSSGDIFVADGYGNSCVHRFSAEGKYLLSWGTPGSGRGQFSTPHGIWVDGRDRVYVADRENNRVQVFSIEGDYLQEWGALYHPMDIFIDRDNRVYVTDQTPRFTVFNTDGKIVDRGRTPDVGHGLWGDTKGNLYLSGNARSVAKFRKV